MKHTGAYHELALREFDLTLCKRDRVKERDRTTAHRFIGSPARTPSWMHRVVKDVRLHAVVDWRHRREKVLNSTLSTLRAGVPGLTE